MLGWSEAWGKEAVGYQLLDYEVALEILLTLIIIHANLSYSIFLFLFVFV